MSELTIDVAAEMRYLAKEAMEVQDACNMLGVSKGFARAVQRVSEVLRAGGVATGTDQINNHPVVRMWVSKLESLCGIQYDEGALTRAYNRVDEWSKRDDITPEEFANHR